MGETIFLMLVQSKRNEQLASIVIKSLHEFGGKLSNSPIWVFIDEQKHTPKVITDLDGVKWFNLAMKNDLRSFPFVEKVYACAQAEALLGSKFHTLVWLSLDCLIVNPPLLFDLCETTGYPPADAAFRPVHHQNIGSLATEPLDPFWSQIYQALGINELHQTITTFADKAVLRPYFNSHCFSFHSGLGLASEWWHTFQTLVVDQNFQANSCQSPPHKVFLHQAILSTLVTKKLPWDRIRLLPPEYNFPLNLWDQISEDDKPETLNKLVNAVYEDVFPLGEIKIEEPLLSWIEQHL